MKNCSKKILCASLAALAVSLSACSTETPESSFDSPLPWHAVAESYEKLTYSVAVYDTQNGESEDARTKIGDGSLEFTLDEGAMPGYTVLDMSFSVTYLNIEAAGKDAGLTDTISSRVTFEPNSLAAKDMVKTVTLADREGEANLSYTVTADYFGTHKASLTYAKKEGTKTLSLPDSASRDNEMMFFIARAQDIGENSSTNFKMINVFDSFVNGQTAEYTMIVSGGSKRKLNIGDFVKEFGIPAAEDDATSYPINCIATTLTINAEKHGPSYNVTYALDPFIQNDAKHNKIPLKIEYFSYQGSNPYRLSSYTLSGCSFTK